MKNLLKQSWTLLVVGSLTVCLYAQLPKPDSIDTKLSGSFMQNEDAAKRSTDILVASFKKSGNPTPDGTATMAYENSAIEVSSTFKGSLAGIVKVLYLVRFIPSVHEEKPPSLNLSYIVFIQKVGPNQGEILKLLPVTDENIASVKALISTKGTP